MALLLLPAALLAAPPAPTPAEVLVDALEGVTECVVEGRTARLEGRLRHAKEAWAARRDTLAKRIPPSDLDDLDLCFLRLDAGGRPAARAALDAQELLGDLLPQGPARHRRSAALASLRAWFAADGGRWSEMPDLEAAFAPLLGPPCPEPAAAAVRTALDRHREARTVRNAPQCKRAARTLQDLARASA
ncbi:hypothetical protein GETHPA_22550 [Geothrix rubra]|uniref:Lysozyme inhibitor LprI N-terminal domain-containing protein n=1 Tax=Geothrix rubra TaxID=2927977 RepID=A0ABQ5Q7T1_9BACT|nr:hypothetical protein [Geothrix rubra]GLH70722.1 hypothetical protein GETHPA_22550 [Geothrix rubra]